MLGDLVRDEPDLPVRAAVPELTAALAEGRRALLVAPPGAGKTTLVPLLLADEPWLAGSTIVLLEPRRLAARAAARRMADLLGDEVGGIVGLQTRDERRIGPRTRIEVVTEGILTRRIQRDPELAGTGLVIFDEVHERNLPTDLGLALTLEVADALRPDLRILAMSATADTDRLVTFLDADLIESAGRTHDVDLRWIPRHRDGKSRRRPGHPAAGLDVDAAQACLRALGDDDGDLLVFLPGIAEIRRTQERLRDALGPGVDVFPLAGAVSVGEQDEALAPSAAGRRRIVLATDIAETSLTVEGVRIVIDGGFVREPRFDVGTGMTRLTTVVNSRASADQRSGRAGRTAPGVAYRLWSKAEHGTRPRHPTAEILQTDLAGLALELATWGGADDLRFPDPPPAAALRQARDLLGALHALDADGVVTPLGRTMAELPLHPRLARMIALDPSPLSCVVAALLDERDVFRGRPDHLPVDISLRVDAVTGRKGDERADRNAVRRVRQRALDIARRARIDAPLDVADGDDAGRVLLLAFPDRLAGRRRTGQFTMRSGSGAFVPPDDPLADERFLVAADVDGRRDRTRVRLAGAVDAAAVLATHRDDVTERTTVEWDPERADLVETTERRLGAIELGRTTGPPRPGDATTAALVARLRRTKLDELSWTPAADALRQRVAWLHRTRGEPWPDWSVEALLRHLDDWLVPYLPGATGRADLERLDLVMVLRAQLPWPEGADLDTLAPATLAIAGGRQVPIDYRADGPSVAVRVQDLFGTRDHPHVAGAPIRLELLSPADRPIQVTSDLPGFWAGSWDAVRKDMAGRYPKHHWPVDPASAPPRRLGRD